MSLQLLTALVVGSTFAPYIFWFKGWFFIAGTAMAANVSENWLTASHRSRSVPWERRSMSPWLSPSRD